MPRLRDLPIAGKMAVASVAALVLLAFMTWAVFSTFAVQRGLAAQVESASSAKWEAGGAIAAARGLRAQAERLQFEQTPAGVEVAAASVVAGVAEVLGHLDAMRDPQVADTLQRDAAAALQQLAQTLARKAQLRAALLSARDNAFLPNIPVFDDAFAGLRLAIANASLSPAERDAIGRQLQGYQGAVSLSRDNALVFLVSGRAGVVGQVANVSVVMHTLAGDVLNSALPEAAKADARRLFAAGDAVLGGAAELFAAKHELAQFDRDALEPAALTLETRLGAAAEAFSRVVADNQARSLAAQDAARRELAALAGLTFTVLVASGWLTGRAVAGPIAAMTRRVQAMAAGDTDGPIGFGGRRDEIGRIAAALETLRGAVRRAHVQAQMIEQAPIGVITADAEDDLRITYVNAEGLRMVELVHEHLTVGAATVVGTRLDQMNPSALMDLRAATLTADQLPSRSVARIGPEMFEVRVAALRRADGGYIGPMLSLSLVTRQKRLSDVFERSVAEIASAVGTAAAEMEQSAAVMSEAAAGSGRRLALVAGASQAANGNVQAVAASAEQLAASVARIARRVDEGAAMAAEAVAEAVATDRTVASLAEAATRIGDVVRLIGDIAGRTNLLALNATIEAARAGEAGRGFAVVATEVKLLASQTAKATADIAAQITAMQGATRHAVVALRSIGGTVGRMSGIARAVADAVEEQGAATREIAAGVAQAASGTAAVDGNIAEVAHAVGETGARAGAVVVAARALTGQADTLGREVSEFLGAIRAAA